MLFHKNLDIICQAVIISRISVFRCFLSFTTSNCIDAFLKGTHKYGLTSTVYTCQELLHISDKVLFKSMKDKANCINHLPPNSKTNGYILRKRDHSYVLPFCKKTLLVVLFGLL